LKCPNLKYVTDNRRRGFRFEDQRW
jgi:hypothetical protein